MRRLLQREIDELHALAARGGLGSATAVTDVVAEGPDQLMHIEGDVLVLLLDAGDELVAYCEGDIGWVKRENVKLDVPVASSSEVCASPVPAFGAPTLLPLAPTPPPPHHQEHEDEEEAEDPAAADEHQLDDDEQHEVVVIDADPDADAAANMRRARTVAASSSVPPRRLGASMKAIVPPAIQVPSPPRSPSSAHGACSVCHSPSDCSSAPSSPTMMTEIASTSNHSTDTSQTPRGTQTNLAPSPTDPAPTTPEGPPPSRYNGSAAVAHAAVATSVGPPLHSPQFAFDLSYLDDSAFPSPALDIDQTFSALRKDSSPLATVHPKTEQMRDDDSQPSASPPTQPSSLSDHSHQSHLPHRLLGRISPPTRQSSLSRLARRQPQPPSPEMHRSESTSSLLSDDVQIGGIVLGGPVDDAHHMDSDTDKDTASPDPSPRTGAVSLSALGVYSPPVPLAALPARTVTPEQPAMHDSQFRGITRGQGVQVATVTQRATKRHSLAVDTGRFSEATEIIALEQVTESDEDEAVDNGLGLAIGTSPGQHSGGNRATIVAATAVVPTVPSPTRRRPDALNLEAQETTHRGAAPPAGSGEFPLTAHSVHSLDTFGGHFGLHSDDSVGPDYFSIQRTRSQDSVVPVVTLRPAEGIHEDNLRTPTAESTFSLDMDEDEEEVVHGITGLILGDISPRSSMARSSISSEVRLSMASSGMRTSMASVDGSSDDGCSSPVRPVTFRSDSKNSHTSDSKNSHSPSEETVLETPQTMTRGAFSASDSSVGLPYLARLGVSMDDSGVRRPLVIDTEIHAADGELIILSPPSSSFSPHVESPGSADTSLSVESRAAAKAIARGGFYALGHSPQLTEEQQQQWREMSQPIVDSPVRDNSSPPSSLAAPAQIWPTPGSPLREVSSNESSDLDSPMQVSTPTSDSDTPPADSPLREVAGNVSEFGSPSRDDPTEQALAAATASSMPSGPSPHAQTKGVKIPSNAPPSVQQVPPNVTARDGGPSVDSVHRVAGETSIPSTANANASTPVFQVAPAVTVASTPSTTTSSPTNESSTARPVNVWSPRADAQRRRGMALLGHLDTRAGRPLESLFDQHERFSPTDSVPGGENSSRDGHAPRRIAPQSTTPTAPIPTRHPARLEGLGMPNGPSRPPAGHRNEPDDEQPTELPYAPASSSQSPPLAQNFARATVSHDGHVLSQERGSEELSRFISKPSAQFQAQRHPGPRTTYRDRPSIEVLSPSMNVNGGPVKRNASVPVRSVSADDNHRTVPLLLPSANYQKQQQPQQSRGHNNNPPSPQEPTPKASMFGDAPNGHLRQRVVIPADIRPAPLPPHQQRQQQQQQRPPQQQQSQQQQAFNAKFPPNQVPLNRSFTAATRPRSRSFSATIAKSFGKGKTAFDDPPPMPHNQAPKTSFSSEGTGSPSFLRRPTLDSHPSLESFVSRGALSSTASYDSSSVKSVHHLQSLHQHREPSAQSFQSHSTAHSSGLSKPQAPFQPHARSASSPRPSIGSGSLSRKTSAPMMTMASLRPPVSHRDFADPTVKTDGMEFEIIKPTVPFGTTPTVSSEHGFNRVESDMEAIDDSRPELDEWGFLKFCAPTPQIFQSRQSPSEVRAAEQKWLAIISQPLAHGQAPSKKIRRMVIEGGVPASLRGRVWAWFLASTSHRVDGLFGRLVSNDEGEFDKQIEGDIEVVYSDHSAFYRDDSPAKTDLRTLLRAYVHFAPSGYRSDIAKIGGALLIHTAVEDAFWLLEGLFNNVLKTYYVKDTTYFRVDLNVFAGILEGSEPRIAQLFRSVGVQPQDYLPRWWSGLFIRHLPWPTVLRIFDTVISEGSRYLLISSLAIITLSRDRLAALPRGKTEVLDYLRNLPQDSLLLPETFMRACDQVKLRDDDLKRLRASVKEQMFGTR